MTHTRAHGNAIGNPTPHKWPTFCAHFLAFAYVAQSQWVRWPEVNKELKRGNVGRWLWRWNNPPPYFAKVWPLPLWGFHLECVDACARRCARILRGCWISKRRRLFGGVPNCRPSLAFLGLVAYARAGVLLYPEGGGFVLFRIVLNYVCILLMVSNLQKTFKKDLET